MREFRLVIYMNASDSRNFWGGRGAASPLAYSCHLGHKKSKVFLGGTIVLKGLGRYHRFVREKLDAATKPVTLPLRLCCDGEEIVISDEAFIYQNDDPLLGASQNGIYWTAKVGNLGLRERFSDGYEKRFTLGAVRIGLDTCCGRNREVARGGCRVLASRLQKLRQPLDSDSSNRLLVYGADHRERSFWTDNGMPRVPRRNAFVHVRNGKWPSAQPQRVEVRELIDSQIKNNHINESLVHEMLKVLFATGGWWVNYELPAPLGAKGKSWGRIDFLVRKSGKAPWRLIEVKLADNPEAVLQLRDYLQGITRDVRKNGEDSYFWPLWVGAERCKKIKGVVLCQSPGTETKREVKSRRLPYEVWTYTYHIKGGHLDIEVRDARNKRILSTT